MISIKREGSFLYARAYRPFVIALIVVYVVIGAALAVITASAVSRLAISLVLFGLVAALCVAIWLSYLLLLWAFRLEGRQTVEIDDEGVRERLRGRERTFIPWQAVNEIEVAATIVAGASIRVKASFSEIAISNVDLVLEDQMTLGEMHRALGRTTRIRSLLEHMKRQAPGAEVRMNRLARKRLKKFDWAKSS